MKFSLNVMQHAVNYLMEMNADKPHDIDFTSPYHVRQKLDALMRDDFGDDHEQVCSEITECIIAFYPMVGAE